MAVAPMPALFGSTDDNTGLKRSQPSKRDQLSRLCRHVGEAGRQSQSAATFRRFHGFSGEISEMMIVISDRRTKGLLHRVLNLLTGRDGQALKAWLKDLPEAKVVSRDRWTA
jgi:hypothetical protein